MALFGRKNTNNEVPEDLQQYYNTGGTGVFKWILRAVAGVIVLALLVWGGIWAAHKISNGDETDKPQTAQNNSSDKDQQKKAQEQAKADADAKKAAEEAQKKAAAAAQAQQQQQAQQQAQTQQPSQVATNDGSSSQPSQTQSTGGSGGGSTSSATDSSNLPNTGPGETAVVLFAGATVLGAAAHMMLTRKRQLR